MPAAILIKSRGRASCALAGSIVVVGEGRQWRDSVDVDSGRVDSCHGHFCASDDRSGHTERKDSWNDDGSPDAHDFLRHNFPGQGPGSPALPDPGMFLAQVEYCRLLAFSCIAAIVISKILKRDFCF